MKKFYLILLLFTALQVSAQEFHFIPKVGLNLANIFNADGDIRSGLNIGVSGEIKLARAFAIEPGLYYSMQGSKSNENGVGGKIKNDYLNIPILAKGYLYKGFNVFVGPQLGFLVSSKAVVVDSDVSVSAGARDFFNAMDFSVVFGVGYQFDLGLSVSANYNMGLTNVFKNDEISEFFPEAGDIKTRNDVFQLNIGWRF